MRLILAIASAGGLWMLMRGGGRILLPPIPRWWVVVAVAGFGVGTSAGLSPLASGGLGVAGIVIVQARARAVRRRASSRMAERWPDFLALVRGRIATGEPLPDAVRVAARSIGGPFLRLDQAWGGTFADGLRAVQAEWRQPLADRVLTTIRVAAETGGAQVDNVLSKLALSLSDEIHLRRAHEAAVAQQQLTAMVALVAPWAILGLSIVTNPQTSIEFSTREGHVVLAAGACATGVGYLLARRAVRLSEPPRVFG